MATDVSDLLGDVPVAVDGYADTRLTAGMFSSEQDDWQTPAPLYARLDAEFRFDLDPCCYAHTAKCARFLTRADDGLRHPWNGRVFMNPPYGRVLGDWVAKAWREAHEGRAEVVVCLIPARTDTAYWHDLVMRAAEVRLFRGRIAFVQPGEPLNTAPFPSCLVVFRPGHDGPPAFSSIAAAGDGRRQGALAL